MLLKARVVATGQTVVRAVTILVVETVKGRVSAAWVGAATVPVLVLVRVHGQLVIVRVVAFEGFWLVFLVFERVKLVRILPMSRCRSGCPRCGWSGTGSRSHSW